MPKLKLNRLGNAVKLLHPLRQDRAKASKVKTKAQVRKASQERPVVHHNHRTVRSLTR